MLTNLLKILRRAEHPPARRWLIRLLTIVFLAPVGLACAQTVTVAPTGYVTVALGGTVQFSATVTGVKNTAVTWSITGQSAGSTKLGSINSAGLFTGPTTLPSGSIQIVATSVANPAAYGVQYVYVLTPGPTLTSVTPNPLPLGSFTVVLTGSGFGPYPYVIDTYNGSPVSLSVVSYTSTSITAVGYQPSAPTATFTVVNPGSSPSNAIVVPIGNAAKTYALTVNNGSGSGSYAAGAIVSIAANSPALGTSFLNWTGATFANGSSSTTTLTMPAAATTVGANYQVAFPVTSHPRMWITSTDVPRLQSWATATNPAYQKGMAPLLAQAVTNYNTQFFPGGVANTSWPDAGDSNGYTGPLTEEVALVLAFNSLIDPSAANRISYAQYARNLIMVPMNLAAKGVLADAPFRDASFPISNRANVTGMNWGLIVDWLYNATDSHNNSILTSTDKATIRKVFLMWAGECLSAETVGGDSPQPAGVTNSLSLLNNGVGAYRMANNSFYLGHARLLTTMALSFDPTDDPVINAAQSATTLGNTLRSYILDANGAWLYQINSMMGDPQTVAGEYGLSSGAGFGLASGGMPPEGTMYGRSFGYVLGQLLALQTAGYNNPAYSGPQIGLIGAPVWDRYVTGFMSMLSPIANTPATESSLGPVHTIASFGDSTHFWVTPDQMVPFALLALLEGENGKTTHLNSARWFTENAVQGTVAGNISNPWNWGSVQAILAYMLLDPGALPASDPRPTFPLNYFDPAEGRVVAHDMWGPSGNMFTYKAGWSSIFHQQGDAGQFEFFRNGEFLTSQMTNYDTNELGLITAFHNGLAIKNWSANGIPTLETFENNEWLDGSMWILGRSAGDPTTVNSFGPGYSYVSSNLTNLYNLPNLSTPAAGAIDVAQATRSIVWLNSDFIVVYDRATTNHAGLFKSFNLCLAEQPTITGNIATEVMPSGQRLIVQALLPQDAVMTSVNGASKINSHADLDPMFYVLSDQDPTMPSNMRFLHVLQGVNAGVPAMVGTYVQSSSGTPFDGAEFGSNAVFFPVSSGATILTTTFNIPIGITTIVIAGLTPGASYGVSSTKKSLTLTVGGGYVADSAGLLKATL